jgi:hypothetical protein
MESTREGLMCRGGGRVVGGKGRHVWGLTWVGAKCAHCVVQVLENLYQQCHYIAVML